MGTGVYRSGGHEGKTANTGMKQKDAKVTKGRRQRQGQKAAKTELNRRERRGAEGGGGALWALGRAGIVWREGRAFTEGFR
jgi:hypothetical protein